MQRAAGRQSEERPWFPREPVTCEKAAAILRLQDDPSLSPSVRWSGPQELQNEQRSLILMEVYQQQPHPRDGHSSDRQDDSFYRWCLVGSQMKPAQEI